MSLESGVGGGRAARGLHLDISVDKMRDFGRVTEERVPELDDEQRRSLAMRLTSWRKIGDCDEGAGISPVPAARRQLARHLVKGVSQKIVAL